MRIWRIVRKRESLKFFVFNSRQWCESHPLRQTRSFVFINLPRPSGFSWVIAGNDARIATDSASENIKNRPVQDTQVLATATWVDQEPCTSRIFHMWTELSASCMVKSSLWIGDGRWARAGSVPVTARASRDLGWHADAPGCSA